MSDFTKKFCNWGFWWWAFLRGKKLLSSRHGNTEVQVLMNDFVEVFSPWTIEKRRNEILAQKRHGLQSDPLDFCRMFELNFLDGVVKDAWLGQGIVAAEASEYDDLKNGVDVYVDFGGKIGVVGIDLTLTRKPEVVRQKLKAKKCLPVGVTNLAFYTNGEVKSGKKKIPRFVIGVDSWLASALQRELGLSRKKLRVGSFRKLNEATREKILTQIYIEILLEAELFCKSAVDSEKVPKLKELQKRVWGLLAVNVEKRKKMFSENVYEGHGRLTFKNRQMAVLKKCMNREGRADGGLGVFECITGVLNESLEDSGSFPQ